MGITAVKLKVWNDRCGTGPVDFSLLRNHRCGTFAIKSLPWNHNCETTAEERPGGYDIKLHDSFEAIVFIEIETCSSKS